MKKNYKNNIKFLTKSEIRLKILEILSKEPTTIPKLVKETKITYSSVSSNLIKLEDRQFVKRVDNNYHLKPITKMYLKSLMEFRNSINMIKDYNDFWDKHDLNQIDIESIKNINALKDSTLIETTPTDIYKTHNTIKKYMANSKSLKAILPYLHPEYPKLVENILKNGGSVELILPKSIFNETMSKINKNVKRTAIKEKRLKIYSSKNDLKIYLIIFDKTMSLGLFKNDNSFDQNRILISQHESSHKWAEELYEHMKMRRYND